MSTLSIKNNTNYSFRYKKDFENIFKIFASVLKLKNNIKVDVLITDNKDIKKISRQYRDIDKETDVLSFPFEFRELSDQLGFDFLGEIVLSHEKIRAQARQFNHSVKREFCYLFAHGLVHLSGRDHKKNEQEEKEFNLIVYKIMEKAKIDR